MRHDVFCYASTEYSAAVGSAVIAFAHLETAIDVIMEIATRRDDRNFDSSQSFSAKLDRLRAVVDEVGLDEPSRDELTSIADAALRYKEVIQNAAHGTLYARSVEGIGLELRRLYEKTHARHLMSRMTIAKIIEIVGEITTETGRAVALALRMSESIERI